MVVLGQPADEDDVFALEALQTCAAEIEAETGAQAVII